MKVVEARVREINPLSRILYAKFGKVGLETVLDVTKTVDQSAGVLSHEKAAPVYLPSDGLALRLGEVRNAVKEKAKSGASDHSNHLSSDGLTTFSFESEAPLSLALFQDWIGRL